MAHPLDIIESRLRTIIEESADLFPWSHPEHQLIHQLVRSVNDNLSTDSYGRLTAPAAYVIYINPDCTAAWQTHTRGLNELALSLQQSTNQSGIQLSGPPSLRLAFDASLLPDEIRVEVAPLSPESGQTAAMPALAIPPAAPEYPSGACLIAPDGLSFPLQQPVVNIGRRSDNHLLIDDPRISRTHAQLRAVRGQFILMDLNSTSGTFVNGERVTQAILHPGDVISFAGVPFIYHEETQPEA